MLGPRSLSGRCPRRAVKSRSVKRHLFNLLAAISLLICAVTLVFWVRSSRHFDYAAINTTSRIFVCTTFPGGVKLSYWPEPVPGRRDIKFRSYMYNVPDASGQWISPPPVSWAKLGFDVKSIPSTPSGLELDVPFWLLTVLFLSPPLTSAFNFARRRCRQGLGQCVHCGYDLRASKDRCPECGTAIPAGANSAEHT